MSEASTPAKRRGWGVVWLGLAVLGVGGVGWLLVDEVARRDPARCSAVPAARAEVTRGAWAEPDMCTYFDRDGQRLRSIDQFASPDVRSPAEVLWDNSVALGSVALAACATTLIVTRGGTRPRRPSGTTPSHAADTR